MTILTPRGRVVKITNWHALCLIVTLEAETHLLDIRAKGFHFIGVTKKKGQTHHHTTYWVKGGKDIQRETWLPLNAVKENDIGGGKKKF